MFYTHVGCIFSLCIYLYTSIYILYIYFCTFSINLHIQIFIFFLKKPTPSLFFQVLHPGQQHHQHHPQTEKYVLCALRGGRQAHAAVVLKEVLGSICVVSVQKGSSTDGRRAWRLVRRKRIWTQVE